MNYIDKIIDTKMTSGCKMVLREVRTPKDVYYNIICERAGYRELMNTYDTLAQAQKAFDKLT